MNFLKVIGKHITFTGILEVLFEENVLGPKAAEQVLSGKSYERGMKIRKKKLLNEKQKQKQTNKQKHVNLFIFFFFFAD